MGRRGIQRVGALLVAGIVVSAPVWASVESHQGERREPPQEAFDVCKGKTEGASVTIVTPNGGTIKGTCKKFKDTLAAVPEGAPPPKN